MTSSIASKQRVRKNLISTSELAVLQTLRQRSTEQTTSEVSDIATATGIRDSDEVWRALYSLEGKNLVKPHPAGDFTSHHWAITDVGVKAVELMNN